MKTVILSGGFGTRISEYTESIPKPLIPIGGRPLLTHIMERYAKYGHKDFYLALGYKAELIKEYFLNYKTLNSDFTVDMSTGEVKIQQSDPVDWRVTMINTGLHSMTGGRVKRFQSIICNEPFMLTYGDGLSDINIDELLDFHRKHGKMVTVTAVRPAARFGELTIKDRQITSFAEKPQTGTGWINGGYFVINPDFFDLIENDFTVLEREPLEQAAVMGELMAFLHEGFWQCVDTKRDKDILEGFWAEGNIPWKK